MTSFASRLLSLASWPAHSISSAKDSFDTRPGLEDRAARALGQAVKPRAQWGLRILFGTVGFLIRGRPPLKPLWTGDPAIRRILVVRVDLLGDTVLSLPAVRALQRGYPHAAIDMLVTPPVAGVLAAEPDIHQVIAYNPGVWLTPRDWLRWRTWREGYRMLHRLRESHYDLAVSISGDMGSIVARASGARRRVGYAGEAYPFFLTDPVPGARYRERRHEVQYVLRLAEAAGGIITPEIERPRLHVGPAAAREVAVMLDDARSRLGIRGPVITLHAGAQNGQAKRWPPAHWAALADLLANSLDALVVLTGGPSDASVAHQVATLAHAAVVDLAGKTSLSQLVALLAASDAVVSGDSGPMHIACAVDRPVVALHGPTDPAISGPTAPGALVLRHDIWCSPCYDASATAECRFGNPVCMKGIAPRTVFAAVRRQLARHGSPDGSPIIRRINEGESAATTAWS